MIDPDFPLKFRNSPAKIRFQKPDFAADGARATCLAAERQGSQCQGQLAAGALAVPLITVTVVTAVTPGP